MGGAGQGKSSGDRRRVRTGDPGKLAAWPGTEGKSRQEMGRKEAASTRALNFFFLPRRSYWLGRSGHGCRSGAPERQTPTSLQARATTRPSDGPNWAREVHSRRLQGFFLLLGDEMTYIWLITTVFTLLEFAIDGYFKSINDSLKTGKCECNNTK